MSVFPEFKENCGEIALTKPILINHGFEGFHWRDMWVTGKKKSLKLLCFASNLLCFETSSSLLIQNLQATVARRNYFCVLLNYPSLL